MVRQNWILLALVGAVLIYEASGLECVVCNSAEANCIDGTKASEPCPADETSCFLRIGANNQIERGCLPVDQAADCPAAKISPCISCDTAGCNNQLWQQCHQCATTEEACSEAKVGEGTLCKNFKTDNRCYQRFVEGKVERGCESDISPATNDACEGNEQCRRCLANDCNKEAGRDFQVTKCVQCNDDTDSCLDGSKTAANCVAPSDGKCYSKVLEDGKLKRGCHSELSQEEITACSGNTCNICEAEGCNKGIFPTNRLQCHQCQKSAEASCADDLTSEATSKICKLFIADDKCYSRVKTDLSFDRGCQSDLPAAEKSCNGLENCLECNSKNCNSLSEQKLKDTTKCQRCNSDDAACLAGTAPAQSCGQAGDACFVRINNGKLERDCLSTLTTDAEKVKCNSATDTTCIACTDSAGCNSQKWLKCHQCLGARCDVAQAGTGAFCTNYRVANKCYQRFVDGKEVERGCEADRDPATENVCAGNQQCKSCSDDGCNNRISTEFQETKCIECKSNNDEDKSCLKGTKVGSVCQNPDGKCYSRIIDGILERGCRSSLTSQEQTGCNGDLCSLCGEAGCNGGVFPANRLSCYQCQELNDKSCAEELTGVAKSEVCAVYNANDKCYSRINAALNFERGCQSDVEGNVCDGTKDCLECDGQNCNSISEEKLKLAAKCLRCDSSDPSCEAASAALTVTCSNVDDSCFVRVNNGKLERNCLLTLSEADQAKCKDAKDASCVTCTGQGCNSQKWLKCHQCKETSSPACNGGQQDANAQFCPKYKDGNECYERLESEQVVRGCTNDLSEAACKDNLECKTCGDSACNKKAAGELQTDQRCLQCSTAVDAGGLCLAGTTASQPCKTESSGKCFNQIQTDGQLKRGCLGDLTNSEKCQGDTCKICDSKGCNKGLFPANRLKCYQCTSSEDNNCTNALQGADKSGLCKLYLAQDKCYTRDANEIFERGCQSDLGLNAEACKGLDGKHCETCEKSDCNAISKKKLNGAGAIALNVVLMVVAAVAAIAGL